MRKNSNQTPVSLSSHLVFLFLCLLILLCLFTLLRLGLIAYNSELMTDTPSVELFQSLLTGIRFDLRPAIIACIPLLLSIFSYRAMAARHQHRLWLLLFSGFSLFLGLLELDFYHEFHQRLNSLVFQYMGEDPQTVLSMLWYGFPIMQRLLIFVLGLFLLYWLFLKVDRWSRKGDKAASVQSTERSLLVRLSVFFLCLIIAVIAARGTLRQGPPLRWGDAFINESVFANHMALNPVLMLYSAGKQHFSSAKKRWKSSLTENQAKKTVRAMLLTEFDQLRDPDKAVIRRQFTPPQKNTLAVKNVVVILMESFSGHYVGALGSDANITPFFDQLAKRGLLFRRFFSNGTHTHQGMFATMGCFPNLPSFEYLMQLPEGAHHFSGLPQLLSKLKFNDLYVYNGDFSWDNQYGFFRNQGMKNFIGRSDYTDPVVADPTWGVSDQDMFKRALKELKAYNRERPLYALLQTLSNHTPYALPEKLPIQAVTTEGSLNPHLTAMRYADWALGQFFNKIEKTEFYQETLFVLVGDHGFGDRQQITEMDLHRYYVPLLLIAPGIQEKFGSQRDIVGTQVDIVPTIIGRLGYPVQHQCWGRDLLNLPDTDPGFGIIKPSGSDQSVALISGDRILIKPEQSDSQLYHYQMGKQSQVSDIDQDQDKSLLEKQLNAYLQSATQSLLQNTSGNQ